jgi:hypothetical protein
MILTEININNSAEIRIYLKEGITILPEFKTLVEGDSSSGIRIISFEIKGNDLLIVAEGKSGTESFVNIYSPNFRLMDNGIQLSTVSKGIYSLKVGFSHPGGYVRKEIKLKLQ